MDAVPPPLSKQLLRYLQQLASLPSSRSGLVYQNVPELLLDKGCLMPSEPLPPDISPGVMQACYYNSQVLALEHDGFTYVEGYAIRDGLSFALPHAWVLTQQGTAIDPTWPNNEGCYFGVALETDWLLELLSNRAASGHADQNSVFEGNYLEKFSLLREGFPPGALASMEHIPIEFRHGLDFDQSDHSHR